MPDVNPAIQAQTARFAPINTDFGHNALGSLGSRTVQLGQGAQPRAQAQRTGFTQTVKDFFTRVLDSITPHGVRAEGKFRRGLEAFSSKLGDTLGALRGDGRGTPNVPALLRGIDGLINASDSLTSRGVEFADLFHTRVGMNLSPEKLSNANLAALNESLSSPALDQAELSPDQKIILDGLREAVRTESANRTDTLAKQELDPLIQTAMEKVGDRDAFSEAWSNVLNKAEDIVGTMHLPQGENNGTRAGLLRDAIARQIPLDMNAMALDVRQMDKVQGVKALLAEIPAGDLKPLQDNPSPFAEHHTGPEQGMVRDREWFAADNSIHALLMAEFSGRVDRLSGEIGAHSHALSVSLQPHTGEVPAPLRDLESVASIVVNLADAKVRLDEHAALHDFHPDKQLNESLNNAITSLSDALGKIENLPLKELTTPQLTAFREALTELGVEFNAEAFDLEAKSRIGAKETALQSAAIELTGAVKSGDPTAILTKLESLSARGFELGNLITELGGNHEGGDDKAEIRFTNYNAALSKLSTEELRSIVDACRSQEVQNLQGGLGALGYAVEDQNPGMLLKLVDASVALGELERTANSILQERGEATSPSSVPEFTLTPLNRAQTDAIRATYGIQITGENAVIVEGTVSSGFMERVNSDLNKPQSDSELLHKEVQGRDTGVTNTFWKDFARDNYQIQTDDGPKALVDRPALWKEEEPAKEVRLSAGVDQLREFVGDAEYLEVISRYAHQGLLAPISIGLIGPESPIMLPDGTRGMPMATSSDKATNSYTFSKDGNGNVVLKVDYRIQPDMLMKPDGDRVWLKPGGECQFSYEVTFPRGGGEPFVSKNVSFSSQIEQDNWPLSRTYPRPTSVDGILSNPELAGEFRDFLAERHAGENVDFVLAVQDFRKNPTLEGAREIAQRFVTDSSSPDCVTLDNEDQVNTIRQQLVAWDITAPDPEQLTHLFDRASSNVTSNMLTGWTAQFLTEAAKVQ